MIRTPELPSGVIYRRVLAHQHRAQLHRCVLLPVGKRRLALCARCLAVYPLMLLSLVASVAFELGPLGWVDLAWVIAASAPAMLDWGASRLGVEGSNGRRILTGALLGVALGRSTSLYLADPYSEVFWVHAAVAAAVVVAFEVVRALDLSKLG